MSAAQPAARPAPHAGLTDRVAADMSTRSHVFPNAVAGPSTHSSSDLSPTPRKTRKTMTPALPVPRYVPPSAATEIEVAKPHCFFPLNNHPARSLEQEPEETLEEVVYHPDDDPAALRGIPVFKPTFEQFKQFDVYMEKVRRWGERSSIVKIIPPKQWVDNVKLIDEAALSELEIRSPIEQCMLGKNGVFVQRNVERMRNRPLSIHEWFDKCNHPEMMTPNPKEMDRSIDRDSKEAKEWKAQMLAKAKAERKAKKDAAAKRKEERAQRLTSAKVKEGDAEEMDEPDAPLQARAPMEEDIKLEIGNEPIEDDVPDLDASSHTSHSTGEPLATTPEPSFDGNRPVDPFYAETDLRKAWLPEGVEPSDFTVAGCANIERKFWKTLGIGKSSWYGADLAGSLFADDKYPWNVAQLPNLLRNLPEKLPGVNSPYLYFGMWRAAFSWHVEDMDLFSINYIHFGAPKFWYAVPQVEAERFESVVRSRFPNEANICGQFMRHKSCTISPTMLHAAGIRVNKLVQHQNEFVITFPRGYHAGFNMGFNCAESVNFALPCWVELGRKAKACSCVDFSVRIDVDYLTGERPPNEESESESEAEPELEPKPEAAGRKRKAEDSVTPSTTLKKRGRPPKTAKALEQSIPAPVPTPIKLKIALPQAPSAPAAQKTPPKAKTPRKPKETIFLEKPTPCPCVLCPGLAVDDLAPVFQPSDHIFSLSQTTAVQAHISCAVAVPEAFTEDLEVGGQTITYIKGIDNIDKARWKLKCAACKDKRRSTMGTKIQCTKGKCIRAYHVSCARDDEMVMYSAETRLTAEPVERPDGTWDYKQVPEFVVELLCPTHNPAVLELKKRRAEEELRAKVLAIELGSSVKVKKGGSTYQALLTHVDETKRTIIVRLDDTSNREVNWTALDFTSKQPQMLENEYARPPKRSRKEQPAAIGGSEAPAPQHDGDVAANIPRHPVQYYRPPPAHAPAPPRQYHQPPQHHNMAHPIMPPPHLPPAGYHYGRGPGSMMPPPPRSMPPPSIPPHVAYRPPPHGHMPLAPPHCAPIHASRPPLHMMGPPVYTGASAGHPGASGPQQPPQHLPQQPQQPSQPGQAPRLPNGTPGGVGRIDLGLDRMMSLMASLPPLTVPAIHLSGTNGKGSVSVLLESCFNRAGMRTARYNSPHLLEPRDAVRIDGIPPSAEEYAAALEFVQRTADGRRLEATVFEIATAAAFYIINAAKVDVMIIECGMGGARDATNVIHPGLILASGLTSVGLDHTDRLGNTISAITREKASIAVPGGVLVVAPHLLPEALATAQQVAAERDVMFVEARATTQVSPPSTVRLEPFHEPEPATVRTPLAGARTSDHTLVTRLRLGGSHQLDNLSLALTLLDVIRNNMRAHHIQPKLAGLNDAHLSAGVADAQWQGRCSWLQLQDPSTGRVIPMLVDGAHNADSAATLRRYMDSLGPAARRPRTFVLSLSANPSKTPKSVLAPLLRPGDRVALTSFTTPVEGMPWIRVADAAEVRKAAEELGCQSSQVRDIAGSGPAAVADALRWATHDWDKTGPALVVVCGSLYLVADAYRLRGQA